MFVTTFFALQPLILLHCHKSQMFAKGNTNSLANAFVGAGVCRAHQRAARCTQHTPPLRRLCLRSLGGFFGFEQNGRETPVNVERDVVSRLYDEALNRRIAVKHELAGIIRFLVGELDEF